MTKKAAIDAINDMPKDFNVDELIERLLVIEKIDEAEKDIEEGKVHTHSQVMKMVEEWKK